MLLRDQESGDKSLQSVSEKPPYLPISPFQGGQTCAKKVEARSWCSLGLLSELCHVCKMEVQVLTNVENHGQVATVVFLLEGELQCFEY